jgi:serine/threonine-protein phosphatase PPG1
MLNRVQEIPHEGPFADLMWSDPDEQNPGFTLSSRGAGYMFGEDVVERFLELNGCTHIIRAH